MLLGSAQADSAHRYQAFVGATLIDGTGRASRPDATVLIENERISAVGNKIAIPKNAKVFDVGGKWIVPGSRLRALTTRPCGAVAPKQFCSLCGGQSLIEDALAGISELSGYWNATIKASKTE